MPIRQRVQSPPRLNRLAPTPSELLGKKLGCAFQNNGAPCSFSVLDRHKSSFKRCTDVPILAEPPPEVPKQDAAAGTLERTRHASDTRPDRLTHDVDLGMRLRFRPYRKHSHTLRSSGLGIYLLYIIYEQLSHPSTVDTAFTKAVMELQPTWGV